MRIRIVIVCLVSFLFSTQIQSQENTTRGVSFSTLEQEQPVKGNIYAIIMGISSYPFLKPLNYADKDAELFKIFLKSPAGGNVKEENIFMLLNEDAKAASFWVKGQAWLKAKNLQKGDRVYYFFAGHGDAISKEEYFFLTYDCNPAGDKNNYIVTGNLPLYNLKSRIAQMSTQGIDVVLIMDACRSNELPGGAEGQKSLSEAVVEKKAGETIMLSASSGQEAIEDRKIGNGHGLFTYYLIDGLSGNADIETGNKDGRVDFAELEDYVRPKVRNEAQQKYNHRQIPYFATNEPSKIINKVDSNFFKQWQATKQTTTEINADYTVNTKNKNRQGNEVEMDSNITKLYNYFNTAIKKYHLIGDSSAEYWYNKLKNNYPKHSLTEDATYTLATEMINFAQAKINFYLNGDNEIKQKNELLITTDILKYWQIVSETSFSVTAIILEKGIEIATEIDNDVKKGYLAKLYFLKARSYFKDEEFLLTFADDTTLSRFSALNYCYESIRLDPKRAYTYHLLAKLQFAKYMQIIKVIDVSFRVQYSDRNKKVIADSVLFYEKKAIELAPNWHYPEFILGLICSINTLENTSLSGEEKAKEYLFASLNKNKKYYFSHLYLINNYKKEKQYDSVILLCNELRNTWAYYGFAIPSVLAESYLHINIDSAYSYLNSSSYIDVLPFIKYYIDKNQLDSTLKYSKIYYLHHKELKDYVRFVFSPVEYSINNHQYEIADSLCQIFKNDTSIYLKNRVFFAKADINYYTSKYTKAIEFYQKAIQVSSYKYLNSDTYYNISCCYSLLKNKKEALNYFEKALANGYKDFAHITKDTDLDFIKKTPEFAALLKKYEK